jgi:hypothetical protein
LFILIRSKLKLKTNALIGQEGVNGYIELGCFFINLMLLYNIMKDKTQKFHERNASNSDQAQRPERSGKGRRRAIVALGTAAAAGIAAGLLMPSHSKATPQENKPAQSRELTPAEAHAKYKGLVADTMHTAAGIIIEAYNKDPKDFKIVKGQDADSKYELLQTKDEQSAAVLLPASAGPKPQSKFAADAAYVHWAGVNTEGGISGEVYDITQGTQASNAAFDLGVEMPTDFTAPGPETTEVAPGPQIEASGSELFASSIDTNPSPEPLRDAILVTRDMIANPPFNPYSGASKDLIAAGAGEQLKMSSVHY